MKGKQFLIGMSLLVPTLNLSDTTVLTWTVTGAQTIYVTASNCGGSAVDSHTIDIYLLRIYLPLILRQ
jgi:hypothetical protein